MTPPHKGHVQVAFERRTGQTLTAWLIEHGHTMTRKAAADEIGYASPVALKQYVARYLPPEFRFFKSPPTFSTSEIQAAIARRADNETWASIATSYGRDVLLLKDGCRRYRKRLRDQQ